MGCGSSYETASRPETRDQQSWSRPQSREVDTPPVHDKVKATDYESHDKVKATDYEADDKVKATDYEADDPFIRDSLDAHNHYRTIHGVQPLTHAPDLTELAQTWAETLVGIGEMVHSTDQHNKGTGENIYYAWSSDKVKVAGHDAVDSWYDEIKDYDFNNANFSEETGHFTQVVWADTEEVGVAKAFSADRKVVFVVANYRPAGNMIGDFDRNVKFPQC